MMHRPKQGEPIRGKLQRIQHLRRSPWDFAFLYADEPHDGDRNGDAGSNVTFVLVEVLDLRIAPILGVLSLRIEAVKITAQAMADLDRVAAQYTRGETADEALRHV